MLSIRKGVLVGALALCVVFWIAAVEPVRRHSRFCREVRAELETLAKKRPEGVSRDQWENVVAWTLNAQSNVLGYRRDIPREEMNRFENELKRRLRGPVDLATIDWIWDEMGRLAPYGQVYSARFRPTTPERLEEFGRGLSHWGIKVD